MGGGGRGGGGGGGRGRGGGGGGGGEEEGRGQHRYSRDRSNARWFPDRTRVAIPPTGEPLEFRDYLVNRTAWADSYLSDQAAGYVFCEDEIADLVFIGVESLLRTMHGVRLPSSALEASKRSEEVVQQLKWKLSKAGYFADAPFNIRPIQASLETASVLRAIDGFCPKLEAYQPPVDREPAVPSSPTWRYASGSGSSTTTSSVVRAAGRYENARAPRHGSSSRTLHQSKPAVRGRDCGPVWKR